MRIRSDGWYAPLGGVLIALCGAFSLIGFPLDDVWHRLFGQDVTLWGPTHLMLIGGAAMTLVGLAVLLVEAGAASREAGRRGELPWARWMRRVSLPGAFLLGLSTFQAEFDFGVPQFQMIFHPLLIMLAASVVARGRADLARAGRRARRGAVLARDARADGGAGRPGARRADAVLPALPGRGADRRADRAARAPAVPVRAGVRRCDRHGRARVGVGVDAGLHAAPVERGAAARGGAARRWRWRSRARASAAGSATG